MPTSTPVAAAAMLAELIGLLRERGITFAVAELNGRMQESFQRAGIDDLVGSGNVFPSVDTAVQAYVAQHPAAMAQRGVPVQ